MASYPLGIDVIVRGLSGLTQVNRQLNSIEKSGASLSSTLKLVRGAFIALGGTAVLGGLIQAAAQTQRTQIALNALTGSLNKGSQAFNTAAEFAKQFGFAQADAAKAAQELLRVGGTNDLSENLKQAAALSRSLGIDLPKAAGELAKVKDGTISASKDITEFFQIKLGKELTDKIKDNSIASADAIKLYLGAGSDAMMAAKEGADSIDAAYAGLLDSFKRLGMEITGTDFAGNLRAVGEAVDGITKSVALLEGAFAALLLVIPGGGLLRILTGIGLAFDSIRRTIKDINKESAILEGSVDPLANEMSAAATEMNNIGKETKKTSDVLKPMIKEVNSDFMDFIPTLGMTNEQLKKQQELIERLNSVYGQIEYGALEAFKKISTEGSNLAKVTEEVVMKGFRELESAAISAFTAILTGAKSAREAGELLGKTILNMIVESLLRLFYTAFIFPYIKKGFDMVTESIRGTRKEVNSLNSALTTNIALSQAAAAAGASRGGGGGGGGGGWIDTALTIASFFFAKGGAVKAGGLELPGLQTGGMASQGRAPYIVGERGPELFVPNSNGYVYNNQDTMGMLSGGGNQATVNFNISTVDASDFDELLVSRQALIISIINRALNERGQRSLTA